LLVDNVTERQHTPLMLNDAPPDDSALPEPCEYCGGVVECAARCETRRCADCDALPADACRCCPADFDDVYGEEAA
jgi:hypothetical protein